MSRIEKGREKIKKLKRWEGTSEPEMNKLEMISYKRMR
jgi:hypothetical protein